MPLSGFAAGNVGDELLRLMNERTLRQKLAQQQQMDEQRLALEQQRLNETMRRNAFDESRTRRADQLGEAEALIGNLDAGFDPSSAIDTDVSEADMAKLAGTPQAARVKTIMNVTARPIAPEMAGTMSETPTVTARRLAHTGEQQGERRKVALHLRQREDFDRLRNSPDLPTKVRTLMDLERAGVEAAPIGPAMFETPADRQAEDTRDFQNFTRRESYSDKLLRERARERAQFSRKELASAMRIARRDGIAAYNAAKGETGKVTDDQGRLVTFEDFIDQYVDEYLASLEDMPDYSQDDETPQSATPPTPRPGPRVIRGITRRPAGGNQSPAAPGRGGVIRYDAQGNRIP